MRQFLLGVLTLAALFGAAATSHAQPELCPSTDLDNFSNDPYQPIDCWPTAYGPAAADIVTGSDNFLYCDSGEYALCFFSGPPYPTGVDDSNPDLPCVLSDDGTSAACTCPVFSANAEPYYVAIHSILNLGVYNQTVTACGVDGDGCFNLMNGCTSADTEECADLVAAPVCAFIANQNPEEQAQSLIPGADVISAFSFALGTVRPGGPYQVASTPCQAEGGGTPGIYAGCMTAGCENLPVATGEPPMASCACPVFIGDYQVGQSEQTLMDSIPEGDPVTDVCHPGSQEGAFYVWSAANTVSSGTGDASTP